ncbi:MAG: hypothetical protein LQ348_004577 [Seirophora lacunosa]|nr:MAG: hypothetical protein LQ348_004577 [Seirophora lacunosa]
MANKPAVGLNDAAPAAKDAVPVSRSKPAGNPVFRMLGLPNIRLKLPSRNWLIFLSVTGSFTTAVLYDRYHKRKAQQRWCNLVSHIAQEPLPSTAMPRRVTIFLSAPPGDSLRAARDHFHEYVKPVLVAGAMDWDVIEGRREGDVRAGLAEKIRKRRRKSEKAPTKEVDDDAAEEDLVQELRDTAGVKEDEGVQGDLILGRNTWKEYVRGLHEGWLGPFKPPPQPSAESATSIDTSESVPEQSSFAGDAIPKSNPAADSSAAQSDPQATEASDQQPQDKEDKAKEKEKPKQPSQTPPYISPSDYSSAPLPQSAPDVLPPSTVLPFPHLLGFFNTPIRIYRFLNRRHIADETGREVAALVLASHVRACTADREFASSTDPDASPSSTAPQAADVVPIQKRWEQEGMLEGEERDWHKSAWQAQSGDGERVWKDRMVIDARVGDRMRQFELGADDEERARRDEGIDPRAKGVWDSVKELMGWEEDTSVKGWEHGLVGDESG